MGHHGRIQGGLSLMDPGWVIMGGSRLDHHGGIQGGSSRQDPGWVIFGRSRVHAPPFLLFHPTPSATCHVVPFLRAIIITLPPTH